MWSTLLFGAVASSALVIGAAIGVRFKLPKRLLAMLLAFPAGALITALSFELFEDAYERGGIWLAAIGLFVGAIVFTVLSALLDRWAQPGAAPKPADEYRGSVKLDTILRGCRPSRNGGVHSRGRGACAPGGGDTGRCSESLALGISLDGRHRRHRLAGGDLRLKPARSARGRRVDAGTGSLLTGISKDSGPAARWWSPSRWSPAQRS